MERMSTIKNHYSGISKLIQTGIFVILVIISLVAKVNCQDGIFTQYDYNLQCNNPALVASDNNIKLLMNYKNQQVFAGFNSKSSYFSIEAPFSFSNTRDHIGGFGLTFFDNNFTSDNILRKTSIAFTHGQSIKITPSSYLGAGLQFEFYQRRINTEGFTTGSQWVENQGLDTGLDLGETGLEDKINKFNTAAGVHWQLLDSKNRNRANAGIALYNINRPNESNYGSDGKIPLKMVVSGAVKVYEQGSISTTPDLMVTKYGSQYLFTAGALVNYRFSHNNPFSLIQSGSIDAGLRYVHKQNTTFILRLNQKNIIAGISIGVGTSKTSEYGFKGNTFGVLLVVRREMFKRFSPSVPEAEEETRYFVGDAREFIAKNQILSVSQVSEKRQEEEIEIRPDKPVKVRLEKNFEFEFNAAELNDEAKEYLNEIIALLNFNKNLKLEIIGHTDNVGSKEANQDLSEMRAEVVAEYIVGEGIEHKRIKTQGKADDDPVAPNNTRLNRAKNRRVEFILYTD